MPKKREYVTYSFGELSPKAQERAIEEFRIKEETFSQFEADDLTEQFKQDLNDHYGLGDAMEVGWGLGYSQGDGVCFWGSVDVEKFIKTQKPANRFRSLIGFVSAKISHSGHYCHWNSMRVEVELSGDIQVLLTEKMREEYDSWYHALRVRVRIWENEVARLRKLRKQLLLEWEERMRKWIQKRGTGVKAWIPEPPPVKPELSLDIPPDPPMPNPEDEPAGISKALEKAKQEWKEIEELAGEFEKYLDERIKAISKEMEETGYKEIEYRRSAEFVREELQTSPQYEDREYMEDGLLFEV